MNIGNRLKFFRKSIKKTQAEFGKLLGTGRDTISNYEIGRVEPTDTFIQLVATKYSLSENWLRTGQGEMYEETETTLFAAFAKQYDLSEAEQKAARYLLQLSSQERQQILHHVVGLAEAITSDDQPSTDIDTELEAYRQELEAAAKGGKSSASDTTSAKRA